MNQRPQASLRQRLSSTVIGASVVASLLLAGAVTVAVQTAVDELLDNALQESSEILYGLIHSQGKNLPVAAGDALPAPPHDEHLLWQVVSPQGQVLWRSHRAPAVALLPHAQVGLYSVPGWWRVHGMRLDDEGRMLYVAQVAHIRDSLRWRATGAAALLTLLFGAGMTWWLRRRIHLELRPIADLSEAVTRYDPMAADAQRLPATLSELEPMRHAIHDLGERLSQRVASERAFAAHAAHALRTPLAGMMAQLAVAQVKSSPEALPHLTRMGAALDRLRSVVAALLTLFRAEQAAVRGREMKVSELARHLPFESIDIVVTQDGVLWGDPDLLLAALLNLLDNAQKHGARRVQLSCVSAKVSQTLPGSSASSWVLTLADDGAGMSTQACQHWQQALDAQRYEEMGGLGLMLSDLIARAHGGRLSLIHQPQGLCVSLSGQASPSGPALA